MEWLLLVGLVVVAVLLLFGFMTFLRFRREPGRMPTWLPLGGLVLSAAFFAIAVVGGSWLNVVAFTLNMLVFSILLGVARRPRPR